MNPPLFPCHRPRGMVLVLIVGVGLCVALSKTKPPLARPDATFGHRPAVTPIGRFHFVVSRRALAAAADSFADGARVVPALRCGAPAGVKFYAIRPGSLYARLGLQNGDEVDRIDGIPLTSPDRALEAYARARVRRSVTLDLRRHGTSLEIVYDFVD
jgi:type II secretory pathway component PulC